MMMPASLNDWLATIRASHPVLIDYSLARITTVANALDLLHPKIPVITVTGTNGKGSTIYTMEALLTAAAYQVGVFTSPYLETVHEQCRINGLPVTDDDLVSAFKIIHDVAVAHTITLTEFEYFTVAALLIFKKYPLDLLIFEVGLGGANDAVAILSPSITVITSLSLDHEHYLGNTLEAIALSEAQLLPRDKLGIIGSPSPPQSLTNHAKKINASLIYLGRDFSGEQQADHWVFKNNDITYDHLPYPNVLIQNAVLAIQTLLSAKIVLPEEAVRTALQHIAIKGRLQLIANQPDYLVDVSHNNDSVMQLADYLKNVDYPRIIVVFSTFSDKPIPRLIQLIDPFVHQWCIAPIDHPRAAPVHQLLHAFSETVRNDKKITCHRDLNAALQFAITQAKADDLILAFGSFFVARAALLRLTARSQ